MQWKILLVALVFVVVLASALFFFVFKPKLPGLAQLAQLKRSMIVARIEASQGGRVLANGTETAAWNSTRPFTLVLEAKPGECHVFDHWLVNGTRLEGEMLSLTIAGNTTVSAVYRRLSYKLSVLSNASWGLLAFNVSTVQLPFEAEVPCGATVRLALLPGSNETHSFTPIGFLFNGTPAGTETEIHVQGNMSIEAVYKVETHVLLIETNAPGVKVLVDGQEVTLPARIQRARPFTVTIQAPPFIKVNDTFAWGSSEFQAQDYIRGVLSWITFATGQTPIHVEEAEKTIRVYYHPLYNTGGGVYVTPLYGKVSVQGNTIVTGSSIYYAVNIILPPNWTKARVTVEASNALSAGLLYPYSQETSYVYNVASAKVDAQGRVCSSLTVVFEVVRNPASAHVLSYYCNGCEVNPREFYAQGFWNFGEGNKQYLGRLLVVTGDGSIVRIQVEVNG
ncbi:MAG: hypothetical protein QXU36_04820 [Thermofilum sp.]|uniref:hypothetical protein n=1 Tax=Thermofilum sp. TaxID=1961369 RepID=UPI00315FB240